MVRMVLLGLVSLLFAGAATGSVAAGARTLSVTGKPPFQSVTVAHITRAPGQEQTLTVTLAPETAATTILQLIVTYPGGSTQTVLDQTFGSAATLAWTVPAEAQAGMAHFSVRASDCGCGPRSAGAMPVVQASTTEGSFFVGD